MRKILPATLEEELPRKVADALTFCDISTNAVGMPVSFQERIADMFRRYDEASIVAPAIRQAQPALARVIKRMHQDTIELKHQDT